jgi:hypothetical protein
VCIRLLYHPFSLPLPVESIKNESVNNVEPDVKRAKLDGPGTPVYGFKNGSTIPGFMFFADGYNPFICLGVPCNAKVIPKLVKNCFCDIDV